MLFTLVSCSILLYHAEKIVPYVSTPSIVSKLHLLLKI
jgi:hypothetical protein